MFHSIQPTYVKPSWELNNTIQLKNSNTHENMDVFVTTTEIREEQKKRNNVHIIIWFMLALQLRFISPAAFQRQAYKQMSQDILHSEYSKCFCQNTQKIHTQEEEGV